MAKKKKDVVEEAEFEEVKEAEPNGVSFIDNSFPACVNAITGIPAGIFGDIRANIDRVGPHAWHKPYIEVLKQHGFDMIFFAYSDPLIVTSDVGLEDYVFDQLPTGKCIIMGRDSSNNFKCVAGLMNDDHNSKIVYDPVPSTSFVEIFNVGFFIQTFIDIEIFKDVDPLELTPDDSSDK